MAEIEFEFEVNGSLLEGPEVFSSPTIETLAAAIDRAPTSIKGSRVPFVALQPLGTSIPIFCIPGSDENPYYFRDLAKSLGQDQPFYVLRDPRPPSERGAYSVEEHAAHFCDAIRNVQRRGPYILGGHCYGGIVAFEAARQLVLMGEEISLLALFEVPTPGYPKIARHWKNYFVQAKTLLRGEHRVTLADLRAHLQVLTRLAKRKLESLVRRAFVAAGLKSIVNWTEQDENGNVCAGRSYNPKRLSCSVVQFIAADEEHRTMILDDPRLGWRDAVGESFSVRSVSATADAIFKPPAVGELASQLRAVLESLP